MNAIPGGLGHTVDNRRDQVQKTMFLRLVLWIALPAGIQAVGDSKNDYADSKEQKTPDGYWFVTSLLNNTRMIITIFDVELHNIALAIDEQGIEAIDFHGTPTSFVKIPNNGDWNGDNAFTWCFLLYTDVEQTATIMEYEGVTGAADGVRLTLQGTNITGQVFDKNGSDFGSHTHDGLKLSSWNYVLFSYNKIWGHIDVQINDIMQGDFRSSPGVEANALGDITIGGSVDGTGPFKGKIACIQFYEVAFLKNGLLEVDNFYMAALNDRKKLLDLAGVEEIKKEVNDFATSKKQEAPAAFWPISSTLNHDGEVEKSSFLMELHDAELIQMGTGAEAVELKGTPTSYVTIPNDGGLNGVSAFSWFLKIYPKAEQRATILEYAGADGCGDGLRLLQSGTNLTVVMYNEYGHPYGEYARDVLIINQWNFIGITYNKYWGHIDIIYNKDDTYFETFNLQVSTNAVGDITIGSSVNGTDPFHGNINCIQFYNKTLFKSALDHLTDFCDPALLTDIAWANGHTTVSSSTSTRASTGTVTYTATDTATDTTTNTATDTTTDTMTDTTTDTAPDMTTDTPPDTTTDMVTGMTTDAATDTAVDNKTTDTMTDRTTDTAPDRTTDTATNTNTDTMTDTTTDTAPDMTTYTPPDTTTDMVTSMTTDAATDTVTGMATDAATDTAADNKTTDTTADIAADAVTDTMTDTNTYTTDTTTVSVTDTDVGTSAVSKTPRTTHQTTPSLASSTTHSTSPMSINATSPTVRSSVCDLRASTAHACYTFKLLHKNMIFKEAAIFEASGKTLASCTEMCTSNGQCTCFVVYDNGDCRLTTCLLGAHLFEPTTEMTSVYSIVKVD